MRSILLFVLAFCATLPWARAEIVADWQFNDDAGLPLTQVTTDAGFSSWNADLGGSLTTGEGTFRIQRPASGGSNAFADNPISWQAVPQWLVVDLAGWALSLNEGPATEVLRFGLAENSNPVRNYAEIWMGRDTTLGPGNEVHIYGIAELRSGGATWIGPQAPVFPNVQDKPVRLVLKVDPIAQEYEIYYNIDGAGHVLFGKGGLDPGRSPNHIRFSALNNFGNSMDPDDGNAGMEFVDVDRIFLTSADPIGTDIIDPPAPALPLERIVQDWRFNEAEVVGLSETANSAGDAQWSTDIGESFTTGTGSYRIQRSEGTINSFAPVARPWAGKHWLVVDLEGWSFNAAEGLPDESLAWSFVNNTSPIETTAGISLFRSASNPSALFLEGSAFLSNRGGTQIDPVAVFSLEQTEPVRLVLEFDPYEGTYAIYHQTGSEDYVLFGTGTTDVMRSINAIRFAASGNFSDPGEFVDVGRIHMTTRNPMLPVEGGYAGWVEENFPGGGLNAAAGADPDGDGIDNVMEYALGLDPNLADIQGLPTTILHETPEGSRVLQITFRRNPAATDLNYSIDGSSDLIDWTEIARSAEGEMMVAFGNTTLSEVDEGEWKIVMVTDAFPPDSYAERRFLRLRVELQ